MSLLSVEQTISLIHSVSCAFCYTSYLHIVEVNVLFYEKLHLTSYEREGDNSNWWSVVTNIS